MDRKLTDAAAIDSDQLRLALDRLTRGDWQIEQAIDFLQFGHDPATDAREDDKDGSMFPGQTSCAEFDGGDLGTSVSEAIRRWGPPPDDVLREWMSQMHELGEPAIAPEQIDWRRWRFDRDGRLWKIETNHPALEPPQETTRSATDAAGDPATKTLTASVDFGDSDPAERDSTSPQQIHSTNVSPASVSTATKPRRSPPKWLLPAAAMTVAVLVTAVGWWALTGPSNPATETSAALATPPSGPANVPSSSLAFPETGTETEPPVRDGPLTTVATATDFGPGDVEATTTLPTDWQSDSEALTKMAESMSARESSSGFPPSPDGGSEAPQTDAAIDSLLSPSVASARPDQAAGSGSVERLGDAPEKPSPMDDPAGIGGPEIDLLTDDGVETMAIEPADVQSVQESVPSDTRSFVTLPTASEDAGVSLPIAWNASTQLQHPSDDRLRLNQTEDAFQILSGEKAIAQVRVNEGTSLFRWLDATGGEQTRLRQSRLHSGGKPLYLRSPIVADPWPFRFDEFDRQPVWELGAAPVPSVSSMDVEVDIPDRLQLGWIERPDSWALRGDRAIGVITSSDDEGVAIGLRLDVTAGRRLSVRIRTAARMSSADPWHALSHETVAAAEDVWATQAQWASLEKQRLARVDEVAYEIGGSRGKRIIDAKQDRIEQYIDAVQRTLSDLQRLREMMAWLEADAVLRIQVQTHWSDEIQSIVTMTSASRDESQR